MGADESVEIIVTSNDVPAPRRSRDGGERNDPVRASNVWLLIGVGVVALVVGWLIGQAGGDDAVAEPGESTPADDEAAVTSTVASTATAPPTTPPAPTTTAARSGVVPIPPVAAQVGDATQLEAESLTDAGPLAGQPIEIVAYGSGRTLTRLDLENGLIRSHEVQRSAFGPAWVLAGDDWTMLPSFGGEPSVVVDLDGNATVVDFGRDNSVFDVARPGDVWLASFEIAMTGSGDMVRSDELGSVIGSTFTPVPPTGVDPAGGFVAQEAGGWYRIGSGAAERITTGVLLALGADVALAHECDEALACGAVVIDRETGGRTGVELEVEPAPGSIELASTDSISADGRWAVASRRDPFSQSSTRAELVVLDLESGRVDGIGLVQRPGEATWTPDGQYLLFSTGGRVLAYDPASAESLVVSDRLVAVDSFDVRPVPTDS